MINMVLYDSVLFAARDIVILNVLNLSSSTMDHMSIGVIDLPMDIT